MRQTSKSVLRSVANLSQKNQRLQKTSIKKYSTEGGKPKGSLMPLVGVLAVGAATGVYLYNNPNLTNQLLHEIDEIKNSLLGKTVSLQTAYGVAPAKSYSSQTEQKKENIGAPVLRRDAPQSKENVEPAPVVVVQEVSKPAPEPEVKMAVVPVVSATPVEAVVVAPVEPAAPIIVEKLVERIVEKVDDTRLKELEAKLEALAQEKSKVEQDIKELNESHQKKISEQEVQFNESLKQKLEEQQAQLTKELEDKLKQQEEDFTKMAEEIVAHHKSEMENERKIYEETTSELLQEQEHKMQVDYQNENIARVNKLQDLTTKVYALEYSFESAIDFIHDSERYLKLTAAILAFQQITRTNAPFKPEIDTLHQTAKGDDLVEAVISAIPPALTISGVHPISELQQQFHSLSGEAFYLSFAPANSGFFGHLFSKGISLFVIRESGLSDGESVNAKLARAEYYLQNHRLEAAVKEVESIHGESKQALGSWLANAKARLAVDKAISLLEAHLVNLNHTIEKEK